MTVVAIKFKDGTYYAGVNKRNAQTLLGAQLYKSQKTAEHIMESSINFPKYALCEIVEVILEEKKGIG